MNMDAEFMSKFWKTRRGNRYRTGGRHDLRYNTLNLKQPLIAAASKFRPTASTHYTGPLHGTKRLGEQAVVTRKVVLDCSS